MADGAVLLAQGQTRGRGNPAEPENSAVLLGMAAQFLAFLRRTNQRDQLGIVITQVGEVQLVKDPPSVRQPLFASARPGLDQRLGLLPADHLPIAFRLPAREIHGVSPHVFPRGRGIILLLRVMAGPGVQARNRSRPVPQIAIVPNAWRFDQGRTRLSE